MVTVDGKEGIGAIWKCKRVFYRVLGIMETVTDAQGKTERHGSGSGRIRIDSWPNIRDHACAHKLVNVHRAASSLVSTWVLLARHTTSLAIINLLHSENDCFSSFWHHILH